MEYICQKTEMTSLKMVSVYLKHQVAVFYATVILQQIKTPSIEKLLIGNELRRVGLWAGLGWAEQGRISQVHRKWDIA